MKDGQKAPTNKTVPSEPSIPVGIEALYSLCIIEFVGSELFCLWRTFLETNKARSDISKMSDKTQFDLFKSTYKLTINLDKGPIELSAKALAVFSN